MVRRYLRWLPTGFLLLLIIGVAAVVIRAEMRPSYSLPEGGMAQATDSREAPASLSMPNRQRTDFAIVQQKIIFHPNRKIEHRAAKQPIEKQEEIKKDKLPFLPSRFYRLVGTITSSGERIALLRAQGAKSIVMVWEGQDLQGWSIANVAHDHVVLTKNEQRDRIEFPASLKNYETSTEEVR